MYSSDYQISGHVNRKKKHRANQSKSESRKYNLYDVRTNRGNSEKHLFTSIGIGQSCVRDFIQCAQCFFSYCIEDLYWIKKQCRENSIFSTRPCVVIYCVFGAAAVVGNHISVLYDTKNTFPWARRCVRSGTWERQIETNPFFP